jgi:hypothetical protein
METDREAAWKSYLGLLKKAGTRKFTDIIAEAELKSPFEGDCITTIVDGATKIMAKLRD